MTVAELIQHLQQFDQAAEVKTTAWDDDDLVYYDISDAKLGDDGVYLRLE